MRTKEHAATPMSVDDALYEMELVGHDFFLFHDEETDQPSVVYRRHAYRLRPDPAGLTTRSERRWSAASHAAWPGFAEMSPTMGDARDAED